MKRVLLSLLSIMFLYGSLYAEVPEKVKGLLLKTGAHW